MLIGDATARARFSWCVRESLDAVFNVTNCVSPSALWPISYIVPIADDVVRKAYSLSTTLSP